MISLEYVRVDKLVLLSGLEMHAVVITEFLLHALKVLIEENLLEHTNSGVKLVVLLVLTYVDFTVRNLRRPTFITEHEFLVILHVLP